MRAGLEFRRNVKFGYHTGEFQAHFTVVPGDAFCAMESLKTHEQLRSEDVLLVYDSVADVSGAMDLGFVFCFLSHQWLAVW